MRKTYTMNNILICLTLILLLAITGQICAQVRPPDPTPPNPSPNIPAPSVPKVTPPPQPVAPTPATSEPISPTDPAPVNTEKPPAKSPVDKAATEQDTTEYMFMALIALIILGFGIVIGRMSIRTKSKQ